MIKQVTLSAKVLTTYRDKRDPSQTPEPFGRLNIPATGCLFVVQQHAASHLHWDLRLEMDGVLKSWAVPKGPSADPSVKRLAVQTEDHPLDYADFEGHIPAGNYGAGDVIVWDRGRWSPAEDIQQGFTKGKLLFHLQGFKLRGLWTLVQLKGNSNDGRQWLLIKERDAYVERAAEYDNTSVLSGLTVRQLAKPSHKKGAIKRGLQQLDQAIAKPMPQVPSKPMLAKSGEAHNRKGWLWELKYDGYRVMARKQQGKVSLSSRAGHDLTERFPEICQTITHLPVDEVVLDGEMTVAAADGRPSFALIHHRARSMATHQVAAAAIEAPAVFYVFDLLYLNGWDLRACALLARKQLLRHVIPQHAAVVYSEHIVDRGLQTFETSKQLGVEGVVGKRADSRYQTGRTTDWVKVKHRPSGDFVVVGWTPSRVAASDLGSLALGEYRHGILYYVGHIAAGLSEPLRRTLTPQLQRLARKRPVVANAAVIDRQVHWVKPQLVIEAKYSEYTPDGLLRHASVLRLRDDKPASQCTGRFDEVADTQPDMPSVERRVVVTNPEKVLFEAAGFTKQALVDYYRQIGPWLLPYLAKRPILLTRYPDGISGKSFFQRDVPDYVPDWIQRQRLWNDSADAELTYFIVSSSDDLAYLANMATIPIHLWHSTTDSLQHPDWCVLDLDPKGAPFRQVIQLAQAIGTLADEIALPAYVKTSGASGLHVLLPLGRQLDHEQAKTLGELMAMVIAQRYPQIATTARAIRARQGKVYVDFLQNGYSRLIVAPFSVRAEPAASVSMPLGWHELTNKLSNEKYHIGNAVRRMQRLGADPMREVLEVAPDLARSLSLLHQVINQTE